MKLMSEIDIKSQIFDNPGYSQQINLIPSELDLFKKAIYAQWISKISTIYPEISKKIKKEKLNIIDYHKICSHIEHSKIWSKKSRILSNSFYDAFKKFQFFNKLKDIFGDIDISDEEDLGYGNIYWRLVRPFQNSDVGPLHRDSWFWDLNKNFPKPNYRFTRVKVWIAIETELGKNGLLVENESHKRNNIKWQGNFKDGIMKPILIEKEEKFDTKLLNTLPGDTILFNDDLLHGGALNRGINTRVSTEFTLLVRNN